jgi:Xaa-Pro aminopeptidase
MEKKGSDGFLISDEINIFYFLGFLGAAKMFVPTHGESTLYAYGVNYEAAKEKVKNCEVELVKRGEDVDSKAVEHTSKLGLKHLSFDNLEIPVFSKLQKTLKGVNLNPDVQLIWELRKVKDETEIENIRRAAKLTDIGAKTAAETIKPGMRDYELAAELEYAMRKLGSQGVAFETIVASGENSAYPHGASGTRELKTGDLVTLDFGAKYDGYAADLTRTLVVGNPTSKQKKIYDIVMEAREKAFENIKDGVRASDIDAVARNIIEKQGYGDNFVHSLGHGLGLAIHEPPTLSPVSQDILKTGNVVSDEPGIYIVGFGGIRIEDTVLVKKTGAEKLTKAPYNMTL